MGLGRDFDKESICSKWGEKILSRITKYYLDENGYFVEEEVIDEKLPCLAKDYLK